MKNKTGVYETIYGNAAYYEEGAYFLDDGQDAAWDIDMREEIPLEMVDFSKFIRGTYKIIERGGKHGKENIYD